MANINPTKLDQALQAALIPFDGIQCVHDVDPITGLTDSVIILYSASATQQQINQGNAILASFNNLPVDFVDCTKVGVFPLVKILTANNIFLPIGIQIGLVQISGLTTPPTISIGTNSPNYDNIVGQVQSPLTTLADLRNILVGTTSNTKAIINDTWIYLNVRIAAVATQYVVAAKELGQYIPR